MAEFFNLAEELSEHADDWENVGKDVLVYALSKNSDLQTFKKVFNYLDFDYNDDLKDEFGRLKGDEEYKEDEFYKWVQDNCQDKIQEDLDYVTNYYEPIYNYLHKLETNPDEDKVLEVLLNTNCTVLYNSFTETYYIALTGCGMDLSQDIAYAYVLLERWIPEEFIGSVSKQKGLSIGGEKFEKLKKEIVEQSKIYAVRFESIANEWEKIN